MWLVDTSVWVEHFRRGKSDLSARLLEGFVLIHPYVSGELLCGNLKDRQQVISNLNALPSVKLATDAEVFHLIEERRLWGQGLGWVDVHLLTSALLSRCRLWTLDKSLSRAAADLGLS